MQLLTPANWKDYELIDSGDFEKLERFGEFILIRPEPQAVWSKKTSKKEWEQQAHVKFNQNSSSAGIWQRLKTMPDQWRLSYELGSNENQESRFKNQDLRTKTQDSRLETQDSRFKTQDSRLETQDSRLKIQDSRLKTRDSRLKIQDSRLKTQDSRLKIQDLEISQISFRLGLTSFKHVGIFPEQAENWDYIYNSIKRMNTTKPKLLNLFAYTGGASLAAKAAGADVTHVDSIKQVITWARENMELSKLTDIRWVVEDALKFVKREIKRGNKYNGIILDPPAYGHGPAGEKWKLEDNINEMVATVVELLDEKEYFLILNAYSLGFSSIILENLLADTAKKRKTELNTGELYLQASTGTKLPLGVFGRFRNL